MEVKKDIRNREGNNSAAGCHISYAIAQRTDEPASNVSVSITQLGTDKNIGHAQLYNNGKVVLNLSGGIHLNYSEIREIVDTILIDAESVFEESTTEKVE